MTKYLKITNTGICPVEAFTILGVSSARGQTAKIGQFGSGAKMGVGVCLRNLLNPVVVSGDMVVQFDSISRKMGDTDFEQAVAIINGEKKELGFALEFGAIDWTKIEMGLREFISNAFDQGDCQLEVVDSIPTSNPGRTSVFVEYTPAVELYHKNVHKFFLQFNDENFVVGDNPSGELIVYRKKVCVSYQPTIQSLFRYNLDNIKVDESRNVDSWHVGYNVAEALRHMTEEQAKKLLRAYIDNRAVFEVQKIDTTYFGCSTKILLKEAFDTLYAGYKVTTQSLKEYVSKKHKNLLVVSDKLYVMFQDFGIDIANLEGSGAYGVENGFVPIKTTTECKRMVTKVWNKLEKLGLTNGKIKPEVSMFSKPMDCGSMVGGYFEGETIYIERNYVNSKVVLEELAHYITGAHDCTRDFQDYAFAVAGAMM